MQLVADLLLLLGALGATVYCVILSRRLRRFSDLENGVGGAIAVLSAQVDDMTRSLEAARKIAQSSAVTLDGVTERAESASRRLELLMASLHDLPDAPDRSAPDADARTAAEEPVPLRPSAAAGQVFSSVRRLGAGGAA